MQEIGANPGLGSRLTRRDGLRLAASSAVVAALGVERTGVLAQDASPEASACLSDPVQNGASAVRFYAEVLNQGKLEVLDEILDPMVAFDPAVVDPTTGADSVRTILTEFISAFPDASYTVQDTLIEDDMVVIRWTADGTHTGEYDGFPGTNQAQHWSGIHFFEFSCGRIVNLWAEADVLAQLGLVDDAQATPVADASVSGTPATACAPSTRDEMVALAHVWQDPWTTHEFSGFEGNVSPDEVHHFGVRADTVGIDALEHSLTGFFTAFPDLTGPIDDIVVDGDRVAFRYTDIGTDTGGFFGNPPTGNSVKWTGMTILRVECGQIVESWAEVNGFGLWKQLGLLPVPGTPTS